MKNKILVTGATGNIGKEIISLLKQKNANFIATTTKGQSIEDQNTVKFDFSDKDSMQKAMQNIDTLFLLLPSHPDAVQWGKDAVEIAKKVGIKHIVRSSGSFVNANSELLIEKLLGKTDEDVKQSGINYTITAPSAFMQNFTTSLLESYNSGTVYQSAGDGKLGWVDVRDIAAVNVEVLLNPASYINQTLKITGSESFNYQEAINLMNESLGKETKYIAIPNEAASHSMAEMHFPPFIIDLLISLGDSIKQGSLDEVSDTVEEVTGSKPISFKQFVEDHKQVWL